jgi:hypothetical protein
MSKMSQGCVSFLNTGRKPHKFKATDVNNARSVVMKEFELTNFTKESLSGEGILNVYLDGRQVHPIDKVTHKLKVVYSTPWPKGRAVLKRVRHKNKRSKQGLRQQPGRMVVMEI